MHGNMVFSTQQSGGFLVCSVEVIHGLEKESIFLNPPPHAHALVLLVVSELESDESVSNVLILCLFKCSIIKPLLFINIFCVRQIMSHYCAI